MARVMLVDDEEYILKSLSRLLKNNFSWQVESYTNPEEALKQAGENKYDIFIADYRMPVMDGVTMLSMIKVTHPLSVRLILSGHADMKSLIDAINNAEIYRFISKPWNDDELIGTLEQSLEYRFEILENKTLSDQLRTK